MSNKAIWNFQWTFDSGGLLGFLHSPIMVLQDMDTGEVEEREGVSLGILICRIDYIFKK